MVETRLELPPARATDVRKAFTRLSDGVPEGDYGVDSTLVTELGSFIDFGPYDGNRDLSTTLYVGFETDTTSVDDVVDRVRTSTFTGETELGLTEDLEVIYPNRTSYVLEFESSDERSESLKFFIREYTANPGVVVVRVEYSYPADDDEIERYMNQWSGWTVAYPDVENGFTKSIGYKVGREGLADSQNEPPGDEPDGTYVELWLAHDLPRTASERTRDRSITSRKLLEDLQAAGWSNFTLESDDDEETDKLTGVTPDGTANTIQVDDVAPNRIDFFYRSE